LYFEKRENHLLSGNGKQETVRVITRSVKNGLYAESNSDMLDVYWPDYSLFRRIIVA